MKKISVVGDIVIEMLWWKSDAHRVSEVENSNESSPRQRGSRTALLLRNLLSHLRYSLKRKKMPSLV